MMNPAGQETAPMSTDVLARIAERLDVNGRHRYGLSDINQIQHGLHVAAKRYLCGKQADDFAKLSKDSVLSHSLQGGPMSAEEIAEFEQLPHWQEAVRLRRHDEGAKVKGLQTPPLLHFMPYVAEVLQVGR
jgi:predicted HD phosphohydrolase